MFNIFIIDFLFFNFNSKIYSYADDNTLSYAHCDETVLKEKLEIDCINAMKWFEMNNMKANANKFQLMFLTRTKSLINNIIKVGQTEIKSSKTINILGIELDNNLKFNLHIDEVCSQTGKQVNALKRIKHYLERAK